MKKFFPFALLLIFVALVATGACLLTRHLLTPVTHHVSPEDSHTGIHRQLGLTPDQEKALEPIELRYHEHRLQLIQTIEQANAELADAILTDQPASPRIIAAMEKIKAAQGELQLATIAHVFEMKAALTPAQGAKLLELTSQALKLKTGNRR